MALYINGKSIPRDDYNYNLYLRAGMSGALRHINSTGTNASQWIYIADIECDTHIQGEFIIFKIYFGAGNNGKIDQNAYIEMFMQNS